MSEQAYWDIDVPWADAGVQRSAAGDGLTEYSVEPGGIISLTDDSATGASASVISGTLTLFAKSGDDAVVLNAGDSQQLAVAHWWRNDSDSTAVLHITRPA